VDDAVAADGTVLKHDAPCPIGDVEPHQQQQEDEDEEEEEKKEERGREEEEQQTSPTLKSESVGSTSVGS